MIHEPYKNKYEDKKLTDKVDLNLHKLLQLKNLNIPHPRKNIEEAFIYILTKNYEN